MCSYCVAHAGQFNDSVYQRNSSLLPQALVQAAIAKMCGTFGFGKLDALRGEFAPS